MYKIGLSTCEKKGYKLLNEETFKAYSKAGLEAMEISMPQQYYENIDYKNLKRL